MADLRTSGMSVRDSKVSGFATFTGERDPPAWVIAEITVEEPMSNTPMSPNKPDASTVKMQTHSKDADPSALHRSPASATNDHDDGLVDQVASVARTAVDQARVKAGDVAGTVTGAIADGVESGRKLASDGGDRIVDHIRGRPTEALLIAGFIGVVLGLALAR
jgi:ElaB/YqjD/DUF883 family membrane-anchored ribosome-binding protein